MRERRPELLVLSEEAVVVSDWIEPPVPVALPADEPAPAEPVIEAVVVPTPALDAEPRSLLDALLTAEGLRLERLLRQLSKS